MQIPFDPEKITFTGTDEGQRLVFFSTIVLAHRVDQRKAEGKAPRTIPEAKRLLNKCRIVIDTTHIERGLHLENSRVENQLLNLQQKGIIQLEKSLSPPLSPLTDTDCSQFEEQITPKPCEGRNQLSTSDAKTPASAAADLPIKVSNAVAHSSTSTAQCPHSTSIDHTTSGGNSNDAMHFSTELTDALTRSLTSDTPNSQSTSIDHTAGSGNLNGAAHSGNELPTNALTHSSTSAAPKSQSISIDHPASSGNLNGTAHSGNELPTDALTRSTTPDPRSTSVDHTTSGGNSNDDMHFGTELTDDLTRSLTSDTPNSQSTFIDHTAGSGNLNGAAHSGNELPTNALTHSSTSAAPKSQSISIDHTASSGNLNGAAHSGNELPTNALTRSSTSAAPKSQSISIDHPASSGNLNGTAHSGNELPTDALTRSATPDPQSTSVDCTSDVDMDNTSTPAVVSGANNAIGSGDNTSSVVKSTDAQMSISGGNPATSTPPNMAYSHSHQDSSYNNQNPHLNGSIDSGSYNVLTESMQFIAGTKRKRLSVESGDAITQQFHSSSSTAQISLGVSWASTQPLPPHIQSFSLDECYRDYTDCFILDPLGGIGLVIGKKPYMQMIFQPSRVLEELCLNIQAVKPEILNRSMKWALSVGSDLSYTSGPKHDDIHVTVENVHANSYHLVFIHTNGYEPSIIEPHGTSNIPVLDSSTRQLYVPLHKVKAGSDSLFQLCLIHFRVHSDPKNEFSPQAWAAHMHRLYDTLVPDNDYHPPISHPDPLGTTIYGHITSSEANNTVMDGQSPSTVHHATPSHPVHLSQQLNNVDMPAGNDSDLPGVIAGILSTASSTERDTQAYHTANGSHPLFNGESTSAPDVASGMSPNSNSAETRDSTSVAGYNGGTPQGSTSRPSAFIPMLAAQQHIKNVKLESHKVVQATRDRLFKDLNPPGQVVFRYIESFFNSEEITWEIAFHRITNRKGTVLVKTMYDWAVVVRRVHDLERMFQDNTAPKLSEVQVPPSGAKVTNKVLQAYFCCGQTWIESCTKSAKHIRKIEREISLKDSYDPAVAAKAAEILNRWEEHINKPREKIGANGLGKYLLRVIPE
ncbi:hypothetical protein VNI00_010290 [Paramarasmius palmivorus]|uniref:Uncharacterized protein n=1 Tax=Paramarasmius palmivorus TaxID=297713 RepID=A0AAW0CMD5_9AGAR